ncbi:GGDEF domain-containing response regulator [Alteromonas sp. KUL49]|uniref:GGDEF domain-containing protein n=1 Tax=Alteromonas sp. KUL49 TaxID=2480798 RepID=UPI00102F2B08|nr:GGDEF domain-containing response regulator [Alteromonas sp. KUL49]TAP39196.1 GGDEF domain-containing response regulator [Alteromonas sp. KUL49]GEA11970.1 diguanylate cyclase response regulator [Alteromonas sp. KUL49]
MEKTQRNIVVYLVEDDTDDAYLVKKLLTPDSCFTFEVKHFHTLDELALALTNTSCDAILLDLGLSDTRGMQTLSVIQEKNYAIPIIVLTGLEESEFGEKAIQLGAQDYIPKAELRGSLLRRVIKYAVERYKMVRELKQLSLKDPLTSLSNKKAFQDSVKVAIDTWQRYQDSFAVMFIDLDKFKPVNDTFGHSVGDQVLKLVGQRLISYGRTTDTIARVGGDEFAIILPKLTDKEALLAAAEHKLMLIRQPIFVDTSEGLTEVKVDASIGIAVLDKHCTEPRKIVEHADNAMYRAKESPDVSIVFYHP